MRTDIDFACWRKRQWAERAVDLDLDLRGLKCPLPVLRARKALRSMIDGAELRVFATDPMAAIDIPHMCHEDGHLLLATEQLGESVLAFRIRRGATSAKTAGEA